MQIVIDIPEERYNEIHSLKFVMYGLQSEENRKLFYRLINAVQDGTPIPDNATNGDVLISLYPNLKYTIQNGRVVTTIGVASSFDLDWWNAKYRAEMESSDADSN